MANKAKISKSDNEEGPTLQIVNPDCAGIDIANGELQVCISTTTTPYINKRFGAMTEDHDAISELLKKSGVKTVAMESTGVYWITIFHRLLKDGFDVLLCDAKNAKFYNKKTDVKDAQGIMVKHKYGLLEPCFQPSTLQREVRDLYRLRCSFVAKQTEAVNELHKELQQANIKLTLVVSDIMGVTGRNIIEAILKGERDPQTLANLADPRCKKSKEEIAKALHGDISESRLLAMQLFYDLYHEYEEKINKIDIQIEKTLAVYVDQVGLPEEEKVNMVSSGKRDGKHGLYFDIETYGYLLYGTNLMRAPGVSSVTLLGLIAELGHDFTEKFESCGKLCSWATLSPHPKISGGKKLSCHTPKHKNAVGVLLRNSINGVSKMKGNPMASCYYKFKQKGGGFYAHTATAHKLLTCIYYCVKNKMEYDPAKAFPGREKTIEYRIAKNKRQGKALEAEYAELMQSKQLAKN